MAIPNTRKHSSNAYQHNPSWRRYFYLGQRSGGVNSLAPHSQVKLKKQSQAQSLSQTASEVFVERANLLHKVVPLAAGVYCSDKQSM